MNKLTKDKRSQLTLIFVVLAAILAGFWFGLLKIQREGLQRMAGRKTEIRNKLARMQKTVDNTDQLDETLEAANRELAVLEAKMAAGDLHSWMFNSVRQFRLPYRVDIPQFSSIQEGDQTLFAKFPYKQVTITISGTAHYHELGRFIADFENQFPHMRMQNLGMEPASASVPADREKLSFRVDIIALVKPGA